MIPALQEEIQRLKLELEAKDKLCAQLKVDLEMTRRISLKGSNESDEWLGNSTDSNENIDEDPNENIDEEETDDEKPVEPSNDKKTIENADKKPVENADMDEKTIDKIIVSKKTVDELKNKTDIGKTVEDTNHPAIVEIGIGIKTPNDLIQLPTPLILTNLDHQAHQPPSSPKKRTRSLSPQSSVRNLTNDSSPLAPPEMIETPTGPGQGVKRKRRKKK